MRLTSLDSIHVRARPGQRTLGLVFAGAARCRAALGRSGIRIDKREGDGATPKGRFRPRRVWWRADRGPRPRTGLPVRRVHPTDGWCEDPTDRRYNRPVRMSQHAAGDRLWRDDPLYDLIVELDHNTRPRVAHRGSAVFIHVARPGFRPTAGCVALDAADLRRLLTRLDHRTVIVIH